MQSAVSSRSLARLEVGSLEHGDTPVTIGSARGHQAAMHMIVVPALTRCCGQLLETCWTTGPASPLLIKPCRLVTDGQLRQSLW